MAQHDGPARSAPPTSRHTRLKEALRANLKRRKRQARARAAGIDAAPEGADDTTRTTGQTESS